MKRSLIGMVEFNWFGIPFNGADICGFAESPSEEMCIRYLIICFIFSKQHTFVLVSVGCKSVLSIHFLEM